jgi:hypothetical protein
VSLHLRVATRVEALVTKVDGRLELSASPWVLGEEHPSTLTSMANLALTYSNQGRWKEAEELEVQVMEARKRVLGEEHPHTLTSMHNLAYTLQSQGCYSKALVLIKRCYQLRCQILGNQHPNTQLSLNALNSWRAD